ncbi:hypothetical protein Tco_0799440 [Tanacetum coccineum]|uniref:Uncharacterized protein n=1 Tax=Tanacetum coccineum TaxID=301880 RepID=A0ABQ4ZU54_9ASTR
MGILNQQTLAESGTEGRPPILEKDVTWASRFLRFLDNKREEGELMWYSIDNGPLKRKLIDDPQHPGEKMYKRVKYLSTEDMDSKKGISRLMNEFDKFSAEISESLTSVYERFSTLVNNVDRNKIKPSEIALNTKFLNDEVNLAFGRHLEEIHMTWAHLEKKTDKTTELHQHFSRLCSQRLKTASQDARDVVIIHPMTVSQESMTASTARPSPRSRIFYFKTESRLKRDAVAAIFLYIQT